MNNPPKMSVGETADALTVIRSGERARELGVEDPCAAWFVDAAGRRMAEMALQTDRVYEEFNLVRYLRTTARLRALAPRYRQAVFLGAGFDCRAIHLEVFRSGHTTVFEVDTPAKTAHKKKTLRAHGSALPPWVRPVPGDLAHGDIPHRLNEAGYDPHSPALILAEGLLFFLPPPLTEKILDPAWLPLAEGSRLIFDCWSAERVNALNARVREKIGTALFHRFPLDPSPAGLKAALRQRGWHEILIEPLDPFAETEDEFPGSWWLVEAAL